MLTPQGPKVIEYNARFGDPETEVLMPRLKSDLVEVMLACAEQRLDEVELEWRDEWAVSVVLTSAGYPGCLRRAAPGRGRARVARRVGRVRGPHERRLSGFL